MDAHRGEEVGNNLANNDGGNGNPPPAQPQNHHLTFEVHRELVVASGQDIRSELFELMDSNVGRIMYVFGANVHVSALSMADETVNGSISLEGDFIIDNLIGTSNTRVSDDGTHRHFRELTLMFSHPTRGFLTGVATGPLIAASPFHAVLHIYNGTLDDSYDQEGRWRVPRTDSGNASRFEAEVNGMANSHVTNHAGQSQARSNHAGSNGQLANHAGPSHAGSAHARSNGHLPNHDGPSQGLNHAGSNGYLPNHAGSNGHLPNQVGPSQAGSIHAGSNGHVPDGHVLNHVGPRQARSSHAGSNGHVSSHAGPSRARSNHVGPNDDGSYDVGSNHAGPNHDG